MKRERIFKQKVIVEEKASTHSVRVLKRMVEGVWENPERRKLLDIVQVPHRLHMIHQEAIVQQHPILMVDAFAARDLDGRRSALHSS